MTFFLFIAAFVSESCQVAGQICFKHAMTGDPGVSVRRLAGLGGGILVMTVGFFLYLGLLKRFELSYIYPFEGLQRIILVLAAMLFLKERMTQRLWLGVALITIGTYFVSLS